MTCVTLAAWCSCQPEFLPHAMKYSVIDHHEQNESKDFMPEVPEVQAHLQAGQIRYPMVTIAC